MKKKMERNFNFFNNALNTFYMVSDIAVVKDNSESEKNWLLQLYGLLFQISSKLSFTGVG